MWLARLTEMGLLRASFVPPPAIRDAAGSTPGPGPGWSTERTRCWQRLEKLLEDALVQAVVRGQQADHRLRRRT